MNPSTGRLFGKGSVYSTGTHTVAVDIPIWEPINKALQWHRIREPAL